MYSKPLPPTRLNVIQAQGHLTRTGHTLDAHLESEDGEFWTLVRHCCPTTTASR